MRVSTWRHRDGGFVAQIYGRTWTFEVCVARRRKDRFGRGNPFSATLTTGLEP